jgi:hypothetical protein
MPIPISNHRVIPLLLHVHSVVFGYILAIFLLQEDLKEVLFVLFLTAHLSLAASQSNQNPFEWVRCIISLFIENRKNWPVFYIKFKFQILRTKIG